MYVTLRTAEAAPGRFFDLIAATTETVGLIKSHTGSGMRISTSVGGNPNAVAVSNAYETLDDYGNFRESILSNPEILEVLGQGMAMTTSVSDHIGQLLRAPGAQQKFSVWNGAQMKLDEVTQAIPFGLEVCEFIEEKLDLRVGFVAAMTGARAGIGWLAYHPSLGSIGEAQQALETDPEYLDFFKRSDDLLVGGSLNQSIWQAVD